MGRMIKVAEYHNRPIVELELPNGEVWKLRQPLESDHHRMTEVIESHRERVQEWAKQKAEEASRIADEAGGDDEAGRKHLASQESPVELTARYMNAAMLAIFIEPEQNPEVLLDKLGPDIIAELHEEVAQVLSGDAAKKRVRRQES